MTTNKTTARARTTERTVARAAEKAAISYGLTAETVALLQAREMEIAKGIGPKDLGRSLHDYILATSGHFSPVVKNTVVVPIQHQLTDLAMDSRAFSGGVEVGGFLGWLASKGLLKAIHFPKIGLFEKYRNDHSKQGFIPCCARFGTNLVMSVRKMADVNGWVALPVLAKTLVQGVGLYFMGSLEEMTALLQEYAPGVHFSKEDMHWATTNKEKGFKALSQSIKPDTEWSGKMDVLVLHGNPETDGSGIMSHANPFVEYLGLSLGELFQFRGMPCSEIFGYIKGCVLTSTIEDMIKYAELHGADEGDLDLIHMYGNQLLVTTTDMAKRQKPGIYSVAVPAANAFGRDKESDSVILGIQAMLRYFGAASEENMLLNESIMGLTKIAAVLDRCLSNWSEATRFELLDLMKHAAVVLQSEDSSDEDAEDAGKQPAAMTQDFNEVLSILSCPGAKLQDANRDGKLVEMIQAVLRSSFRRKGKGYRAYAVPSSVVEAISGQKMREGEIYLPVDVQKALGVKPGDYVLAGRDPRLAHALVPTRVSRIRCYIRGIAIKAEGIMSLMQMDFDGDTITVVPEHVTSINREAALKAISATLTPTLEWSCNGSKLEELPCSIRSKKIGEETHSVLAARKLVPIFGSWNTNTKKFIPESGEAMPEYVPMKEGSDVLLPVTYCYLWGKATDYPSDIKEDVLATVSAIASSKGIEMADAMASLASFDGDMLSWDKVQFAQKVIEGVKHGNGGLLADVEALRTPNSDDGVQGSSFIFALKAKTKGAAARWAGLLEKLIDAEWKISPIHAKLQPIVDLGETICDSMDAIANLPVTKSMVATEVLTSKSGHDKTLAWLFGDVTLGNLAGVRYGTTDFSNHGKERVLDLYLLASLQKRYEREAFKTVVPEAVRALVEKQSGAPMISIADAKRATKAKLLQFAGWLVEMHAQGLKMLAPDGAVPYGNSGRMNATYKPETLTVICNTIKGAGLTWEPTKNGKTNPLFTFEAKYPSHYQGINALIDAAVDMETILGIMASYFFRVGTSGLADDGKAKSAYLYFIGEYVTVQMATLLMTKGKKFVCPVVENTVSYTEEGV